MVGYSPSNPTKPTAPATSPKDEFELAPGQTHGEDLGVYLDLSDVKDPQSIRGGRTAPTTNGPTGPENVDLERQNSDLFAPPGTDSGDVPNLKWPLGLSHARHGTPQSAGWARQQNADELPVATAMAGVEFHLEPFAYRELHWHMAREWSLVLNGSVRLSAVNEAGQTFHDDLHADDVW